MTPTLRTNFLSASSSSAYEVSLRAFERAGFFKVKLLILSEKKFLTFL
jgi:hypothetical protein